jgi:hypothetical protein
MIGVQAIAGLAGLLRAAADAGGVLAAAGRGRGGPAPSTRLDSEDERMTSTAGQLDREHPLADLANTNASA